MECKIKNVTINYEIIGEGKPIIMLHGYGADHRLMFECMEPIFAIKTGYKRIYLDLPGMGKSSSAEWITNSDSMLEIVIAFIEEIIPNENFLLVGESYGGYLARGILYKMVNRIEGLSLICPVIIADNKKRNVPNHVVMKQDNRLLENLGSKDAQEFKSTFVIQNKRIYDRYQNEIVASEKEADKIFLNKLKKYGYEFSIDIDKIDYAFEKPTVIVLGKQDSVVGYQDSWKIIENFKRISFVILDGAGHLLQIEQTNLFNTLVIDWITRVEEFKPEA